MDTWRFVMVFAINAMFNINFTSPEMFGVPSMGKVPGDKPNIESVPRSMKIWVKVVLPLIQIWYTMCMMGTYYDTPVTTTETLFYWVLTLGFCFRLWCYGTLKQYFTRVLGIREQHKLVKEGPYTYLVHPSYLGQILVVFSYLVLIDAHKVLIIYLVAVYAKGCLVRMRKEEEIMVAHFGKEYEDYVARRWRLIPFIF